MGRLLFGLFGALLFYTMGTAHAALIISGSVGGAPVGATAYVNFDTIALGSGGGAEGGITVSFTPDGQAVNGSAPGLYAAPFLSGGNGAFFGNANGVDTTTYMTTGTGTVDMTLPGLMTYFGILWGSVDDYNTLEFFNGAVSVGTVTGSDVVAAPSGDQGVNGTLYVNIVSSLAFDRVVARSSAYAFEFDNVAFAERTPGGLGDPIPAPMTGILLAGSIAGIGFMRRRTKDNTVSTTALQA